MDYHHNVWLISVPIGRFVADASLSLQKTFVADASLSHRRKPCRWRFAFAQSKASCGCPMSRFTLLACSRVSSVT